VLSVELDPEKWGTGTPEATYRACARDLASEEDRMRTIDSKLSNLAAFSGLSISVSGGVGGSVLAGGKLHLGFAIGLGAAILVAALLLLWGVITAFRGLSPKLYRGVDEPSVKARLQQDMLERSAESAWATFASTLVVQLVSAREANDKKADLALKAFRLVGSGFAVLVTAIVVTAVGSVV
jgi:hypothetical protein